VWHVSRLVGELRLSVKERLAGRKLLAPYVSANSSGILKGEDSCMSCFRKPRFLSRYFLTKCLISTLYHLTNP
jgi:hypothetical protein